MNYEEEFYLKKKGLSMKILNESKDSIEFTFEHAKEYQTVQFHFEDAVASLDHNNIIVIYIDIFECIDCGPHCTLN
jgi:uncharacterized protein YaaN involved in tellurite resistance